MRTIETKVYLFKELDEQTKEKVIQNNYDIAIQDDWYHFTKDDLKEVDIELRSFDIDRGSFAEINIDNFLFNTCEKIIKSHGENSETYKIAERYIKEYNSIKEKMDNLEESMLRQEYEHMTSDEYIIDMFEANEYEFTAEGKII